MSDKPFFQIPKCLLYSNKYKGLKDGPKMLYGFLLDELSVTRIVQNDRVYILMTLKEIAKNLNCSTQAAHMWLNELEQFKLITRGDRMGKTPKLYIHDADTGEEITPEYYDRKT